MSSEPAIVVLATPWYRRKPLLLLGTAAIPIVATTVGLAAMQLLSPSQPAGQTLLATHLPADTLVYAELDLEPEGAQAAALDALNERLATFGAGDGAARLMIRCSRGSLAVTTAIVGTSVPGPMGESP